MHREGKFEDWRQYLGPPPETFDAFLKKRAFHLRHSPLFTILLCIWVCIYIYKFTCDSLVIHLWLSWAIKSKKEQISGDIKQFLIKVSKLAETSSRNRSLEQKRRNSMDMFSIQCRVVQNTVCFESYRSEIGGCLRWNPYPRFYSGSNSQLPDPGRTPLWLYTELFWPYP